MKKLFLSLLLGAALPGVAHAGGTTATSSGTANATIITPIVLQHVSGASLNFGKFTAGTGGTVSVSNINNNGSVTGGVAFVPGNTNAADQFQVNGDGYRNFAIASVNGTVTAGSASMSFTTSPAVSTAQLNSAGTFIFWVGGTLTVGANQTGGTYSGTYTVTVTYN